MESINLFIAAMGIPSAICGLLVWWFKRRVEARDAHLEEREKNLETLMLMMMQTTRANNVLAVATARAVQRIPDAHCNGDMTEALAQMEAIQKKEQQFVMDKGIKYLFE